MSRRNRYSVPEYVAGIVKNDRQILSRAVTLVESTLPEDQRLAEELVEGVLSFTGNSLRIGVSGVPGVGKSTFIDRFGQLLIERGYRVAVLTVDPSSEAGKGSILGDKTRMEQLSTSPNAFIRPSPSSGILGGVSAKTRECSLLCEAAGYNIILIETIGVGQSETAVKGMVDFFLLLALAGAGDELQGIKKGIMEMADLIVINKADGENQKAVERAKGQLVEALHFFPKKENGWITEVSTCSSLMGVGMESIWNTIESFEEKMKINGFFYKNRALQRVHWMKEQIHLLLEVGFYSDKKMSKEIAQKKSLVQTGGKSALAAARELVEKYLYLNSIKE
ncbi:methylmalonyl Co-A mutase-associated GTPase MeaB [Lunatibacter salilacus]|uniref:methylmalonyl Co-A mutase-associated GTPase MeaB n=1 Tax=Lunatibacter salilacus TaxID=2483804 RepID=UPI00131A729E|nr:methylmalonyl Co-A mutase-associated GTPase MeaB [Lunatibacter salilacus]